jgi:Flavodoxin
MASVVVYASKTGKTKAVAAHIAEKLSCDILEVDKNGADISRYDQIVIGSGVYAGKLAKVIRNFLAETDFEGKDVKLFLTCMLKDAKGEEQLRKLTEAYPFISSKTFFAGKEKGPEVNGAADAFIQTF